MLTDPYKSKNFTASSLIKSGYGIVRGVIINSHTSGTLKLWDNTAASGTVLINTLTFGSGEHFIELGNMCFETGLYATIGGTVDLTIVYQ